MKNQEKIFLYGLLSTGIAVQIITFVLLPDNPWSFVSGLFGICSVVLCSQGNILTFFFGFGQILTYTYLCYLERFYAGIAMNAFYFITQIYGIYSWRKRLIPKQIDGDYITDSSAPSAEIHTRSLSPAAIIGLVVCVALISAITGWFLSGYTDDTQPYLDAFTTVPAIVAQVLMILAYREQWYLWLFIDALYVILWLRAGNYCMTAQYVFWCINCVYGFVHWTRSIPKSR